MSYNVNMVEIKRKVCPNCGADLPADAKGIVHCNYCGSTFKLDDDSETEQAKETMNSAGIRRRNLAKIDIKAHHNPNLVSPDEAEANLERYHKMKIAVTISVIVLIIMYLIDKM